MPKIAFFDVFPAEQPILEAGIRNAFPNEPWEATFSPKSLTLDLLPQFTDVDVLSLNTNLPQNQAMLGTLTHLKFIATRSTGYNHFDLSYLQTRNISLANVPSYSEQSVAECVFLLLLSLTKKLTLALNNTQKGVLKKDASFLGLELKGKTFGVWGTGATGIATLEIAKGFGMKLIANSRTIKPELTETLGVTYVSFDELLTQSDFLSLHAPLNAETQGFFGEDALLKMKPSAFLINTARGGVVDMSNLLKVLETGHLSGVGLDVLPHEHLLMRRSQLMETVLSPEAHQADCNALLVEQLLMLHPKVITLPHMAYFTKEALERMAQITIDNIAAWYAGNPVNIVA
jgi:D-lactate dehydrogenase